MNKFVKILKITIFGPIAAIYAVVLSIIIMLASPSLLIIVLPFHIARILVTKCAKLCKPEFGKIMTMRSTLISQGAVYKTTENIIVVCMTLEGTLDIHEVRKTWTEKIMNGKFQNGELKYPELQQSVIEWMGYFFWKWDKSYKLENHLKYYDDEEKIGIENETFIPDSYTQIQEDKGTKKEWEVTDDKTLLKMRYDLTRKPFHDNRSPWELLIIPNYKPKDAEEGKEYTAVFFRCHHAMADGYSILKLFIVQLFGLDLSNIAKPNFVKPKTWVMILKSYKFLVYQLFMSLYNADKVMDVNKFHLPMKKVSQNYLICYPGPIPISTFKQISLAHGTTVSSVIHAVILGAVRRMMLFKNVKVPESMMLAGPLPLPGHPDKLRNYATCGAMHFPIGIIDPVERLKKVHLRNMGFKTKALPFINYIAATALGCVPLFIIRPFCAIIYTTVMLSNFPGPKDQLYYRGHKLLTVDGVFGPSKANFGVVFVSFGIFEKLHITMSIERNLLSDESESEELGKCFLEELHALEASTV